MKDLLGGFQLGEYEVFPVQGRIRGPAGETIVHPRAMEVLLCLAEARGELLEREAIQRKVWGNLTVSDTTLTRCIGELRQAFDDHRENPHYIQTVQKRGYRLVAELGNGAAVPAADPPGADVSAVQEQPGTSSLWQELSRRRVIRVAIAYAVVAWIVTEVASTVFPGLRLPDWTVTLVIILAVLGFPIAVVLAWAFQVSDEGIEVDRRGLFGTPRQRKHFILGVGGASLVAVGAVAILVRLWPMLEPEVALQVSEPIHASIAVLPFVNIGVDPELDYFGDGLAEELTTMLARLDDLAVASRTAAFYFGHQKVEFSRIGESLRVRHILEGSVRRDADKLRVNAQLIDVNTGYHLWSEVYDRDLDQVFGVLDDIARKVVERMGLDFSSRSTEVVAAWPTADAQAYDLYAQARVLLRQPHDDALLSRVQATFEGAVARDPGFAAAYAGLCETHLWQYVRDSDPATFRAAEEHCDRAQGLDAERPEVRMAVGELYRRSGRFADAERVYQQVLASNPRDYDTTVRLAEAYREMGRPDDAEAYFRKAIALEPNFWFAYNGLARFYHQSLRNEEAAENFRRVTELRPEHPIGYINLGAALFSMDPQSAVEPWLQALERSNPPSPELLTNLGLVHLYLGDFDQAVAFQRQAIEVQPRNVVAWASLGSALRFVPGEEDASRDAFERAIRLVMQRLALNPMSSSDLRTLAVSQAWLGDRLEAESALDQVRALAPDEAATWYAGAKVAIALGDLEVATERLAEALRRGYPTVIARLDPDLEPIRTRAKLALLLEDHTNRGE